MTLVMAMVAAARQRASSLMMEIAEAEKISKSYVSRILRLALLAPDIVEAILGGWADQRVMLEKLERPLPVGWEEQRAALAERTAARQQERPVGVQVSAGAVTWTGWRSPGDPPASVERFVRRRTSRSLPG